MQLVIKIARITSFILSFGMAVIAVTYAVMVYGFRLKPYIVLSGSMEPVIQTGSVALIDDDTDDIKEGDIITFRLITGTSEEGAAVTHRVTAVNKGSYTTRGDANEAEDANPVMPQQVLGHFRYDIPKLGFILTAIGRRGIILLAFTGPVLMAISYLLEWGFLSNEKKE